MLQYIIATALFAELIDLEPVSLSSECQDAVALDGQSCKITRGIGAGVNINSVETDIGRKDWRVSVNDIFGKSFFAVEEFFAVFNGEK